MPQKVIIIIPTYNEKDIIASTIFKLEETFKKINANKYCMQILVYDSNSSDGTLEVVQTLQRQFNNIHSQTEPEKSGLGSAYAKAMKFAMEQLNADIVFEFDADGSHQPKYLPEMMKLFDDGADVVVGSRYIPGASIPKDWAWHRKILSYFGNLTARLFLTWHYKDFTSGFRGTRTTYLKKVPLGKLLSKNYAYKLHLFWALHKSKAKIVEFPIEFIDRKKGYSKFPKNNVLESLKVVILLRLFALRYYIQICCIGLVGMVIQMIIFNLLRLTLHPVFANTISVEFAILSNFLLNNHITFHRTRFTYINDPKKWGWKFLQFNFFSLGSLLIQTILLSLALKPFGQNIWLENITVFIGIILGSIINYFVYSHFIWKIKS